MDSVTLTELLQFQTLHLKTRIEEFISISGKVLDLRDKEILSLRQQVRELAEEAGFDRSAIDRLLQVSSGMVMRADTELKATFEKKKLLAGGAAARDTKGKHSLGKRKAEES